MDSSSPVNHSKRESAASARADASTGQTKYMANTKSIESTEERKKVKRAARKAAPPKAKRTGARGENKQKVKKAARGTSKR